jgi:succinate dehydrogenase/fumarate reductase flavoprotein subunit
LAAIGAEGRQESRGVHYRTDFPESIDPSHTIIRAKTTSDHCVEGSLEHTQRGLVLTRD